ncbi:MAG: hypothetical protein IJS13_00970 [Paludibacteraceae bacterium]|nr:hypothetical protein [Paludibacteraceae bacterium]
MRKIFTSLMAIAMFLNLSATPYFVRVNGTTDYEAQPTGESDYQGRDQYAVQGVELQAGDKLTCFNQGSNTEWNIAVIDPYGAYQNFATGSDALTCNVAGKYNIYIKMKMNDDMWYIEEAGGTDPGTNPGTNPGGGDGNGNPRYYWKGHVDGQDVEPDIETMFFDGIASISFSQAAYIFVLYQVDGQEGVQYMTDAFVDATHTHATLQVNGGGKYEKWQVPTGTTQIYLYDNGDGTLEISSEPIEGKQLAIPAGSGSTDRLENVTFDEEAPMYNILGMPVTADYHGIVIQAGRKFVR